MIQSAKTYINVFILSAIFLASNAFAATCFDPSPNFASQGDDYYNLEEPIVLSDKEQDQIKALFKQLHGKWKGTGVHVECFGTDNNPEEQADQVEITIKTELSDALNLVLNTQIKRIKAGITQSERITLIGNTPLFSFDSIDANHIIFSEKYRTSSGVTKKNGTRFTRLVENVYEIQLNGNRFHFSKFYYINGVYVAKDDWQLMPGL